MINCSLTYEELDEGDASICDPDYQYDDILPEDDAMISDRLDLEVNNSTLLINAITLSLSTTSGVFESSCYFFRWNCKSQ